MAGGVAERRDSRITIVLPRVRDTVTVTQVREVVREVPVLGDFDAQGRQVPTNGPHTYTYDAQNNLTTDTVTGPGGTWVRTFTYANGNQATDSGWVKQ